MILGIENSERYFYLLYQQNCEKTEILERLLKYYVKLTHVRRCDVTLFDATTDDKGSVIYLLFKGIFNECLQMKLEDE